MDINEVIIIIPARYKSTRFPGKPLANILGKSMVKRVWESCVQVVPEDNVYVATDDERIEAHCKDNNMQCIMTSPYCSTGTDRVAEAVREIKKSYDLVVNVQGDEPLVSPSDILKVIMMYYCYKQQYSYTAVCGKAPISTKEDFVNPNIVKVVNDYKNKLLYASRSPIPTTKEFDFKTAAKQVCIYAFSTDAMWEYGPFVEKSYLESIEDIEILRLLEFGGDGVGLVDISSNSVSVDVPSDIYKVEKILNGNNSQLDFKEKIECEIKKTIAVDFDGVVHKNSKGYHDGTVYDDPVDGVYEALQFLSCAFRIVIYTCKVHPERPLVNGKTGYELVDEWLQKHDLRKYIASITHEKPRALVYVDDKAIKFTSWADAVNDVLLEANVKLIDSSKL